MQWAAHQAGVDVPDGSWLQYQQLQRQGGAMSVEQALHTRGALLFSFSSSPDGSGRPSTAHVAISLGDGRTIEARNSRDGVGVFTASSARFNYAAAIPGLSTVPSGGFGAGLAVAPGVIGADPFDMPGAALPSAVLGGPGQTDSDGDGLTDRFEAPLQPILTGPTPTVTVSATPRSPRLTTPTRSEIGRASCRERVLKTV